MGKPKKESESMAFKSRDINELSESVNEFIEERQEEYDNLKVTKSDFGTYTWNGYLWFYNNIVVEYWNNVNKELG